MKNKILIFLSILLSCLILTSFSNRRHLYSTSEEYVNAYVLAGQSNMQGITDDPLPEQYRIPENSYILGYVRNGSTEEIIANDSTFKPMNYNTQVWGQSHGIEFPLAYNLDDKEKYLVKVSRGGIALATEFNRDSLGEFYFLLAEYINHAKKELEGKNVHWHFIWGQYEKDALNDYWYLNYEQNFTNLFLYLKEDTGVIFTTISWFGVNKNDGFYPTRTAGYDWIFDLQENLADYVVPTSDLALGDVVHYSSASQITIGIREANWLNENY